MRLLHGLQDDARRAVPVHEHVHVLHDAQLAREPARQGNGEVAADEDHAHDVRRAGELRHCDD